MDPEKRIEELENEVRELRNLVQALADHQDGTDSQSAVEESTAPVEADRGAPSWSSAIERGVGRALGGESGESLESRLGAIWLSRIAVLLLMTTVALGAAVTFSNDFVGPWDKMLIGYGLAAMAILYGLLLHDRRHLFPQTMLGGGLAILYFTTYAVFNVDEMTLFTSQAAAVSSLLGCLLLLAVVVHWRKSQTAAGISLFLIFYTVVLSCWNGVTIANFTYALTTLSVVACVALFFHVVHRWLLFTWGALIATHLTYLYFFLYQPAALDIPEKTYFWISNGFLTLVYVLFTIICITDARKTGEYRRTVAPMAGVNSFIYFCLTWIAIRQVYPAEEWMFRLGFTGGLAAFTVLTAVIGPRLNYLFQIFIAKTFIMLTLAFQAYLTHEWLLVAFAIECLALSFSYKRSGLVTFKALGLGLLIVTFAGAVLFIRSEAPVELGEYVVQANWFTCVGVAFVLCIVAWFYSRFIRRTPPEERTVKGQWFLADTFLDVPSSTVALLHAACAAFLVLGVTIIEGLDDPRLPYMLVLESVLFLTLGLLLRTVQVQVVCVLPLVAAHVVYHAFLWMEQSAFVAQENYLLYTALTAGYTYVGAHVWEAYLRRFPVNAQWEHDLSASIPYMAATFMLTALFDQVFPLIYSALAQNGLAVAAMIIAVITGYAGMKVAGLLAAGIATFSFVDGVGPSAAVDTSSLEFLALGGAFLAAYALTERFLRVFEWRVERRAPVDETMRWVIVVTGVVMGAYGLLVWAPEAFLTLYWLGLAAVIMLLGAVFWESRYRWAAMAVLGAVIVRAFLYDLQQLSLVDKLLSFAALTLVLIPIAWAYSRYRVAALKKMEDGPQEEVGHEG